MKSMNNRAVTLVYDGDGNRVAKTASGLTTRGVHKRMEAVVGSPAGSADRIPPSKPKHGDFRRERKRPGADHQTAWKWS
jgi:hypothetical protein